MTSNRITAASPLQISGVFPHLAVVGDHLPRTEVGIGALMPWADHLWFVTYPAHYGQGYGFGLFAIDADMNMTKHPASVVGTFANRMIHGPSDQLIIGPHLIDPDGNVRTIEELIPHRLTGTMRHLEDPAHKVYFLTMEALLFEADVNTLETKLLFDLTKELEMQDVKKLHFKAGYTGHGRVVVAHNTYDDADFVNGPSQGRLAEWDGKTWTILETCQFNEVTGRTSIGDAILATGADNASAILKVFSGGRWSTYRLPKATHTQDHTVTTEWPRIREVESERWLMNCSGMFYELPAMQYDGKIWGVRPICTHLRIIGDFCSWRGMLVMAGDQTTPLKFGDWDTNPFVGQPQANLWFGKTDDLWQFGKPSGWGGPWRKKAVRAGEPSDPYLMTGFEHKVLHLSHDASRAVAFTVEVDFLGTQDWQTFETVKVPARGYAYHAFPPGYSAHWLRVIADTDCTASAWLHYT